MAVLLQLAIVALATLVAVAPLPSDLVEFYFADGVYPGLQAALTSWSNRTGLALFDFAAVGLGLFALALLSRAFGRARRKRSVRPLVRGVVNLTTLAAMGYLWFATAWGLNYARPPVEDALGYDAGRVTPASVRTLAERAAIAVNQLHASGHAAGFPAPHEMPASLVRALHEVERRLGRPRETTPGRPKRTAFGPFFRAAGVDGMHGPFLLETMLNPDLTPPERPAVLAHEWAHLSGYAPEDEASFVGLLAALEADDASRYSAWLMIFGEALALVPQADQVRLLETLQPGPRADRRAIAERQQARVESVSRASWEAYDRYLKAQGVGEGVASYSGVVRLLVGTGALDR